MAHFALEDVRSRKIPDPVINRKGSLTASEIRDGNLNQVLIVRETVDRKESGRAIIVKQALTYLKVAGESGIGPGGLRPR